MSGKAVAALAGLALASAARGAASVQPGFHQIGRGPDGGVVIQGWIRSSSQPRFFRPTVVYLPWADANLPTIADRRGRVLAGLSAGGYGAVDIGLRHPGLFSTLESWSGYFHPLRAGALVHADTAEKQAHDPSLLIRRKAPLLRRLGTRFFLSSGTTHDRETAAATKGFSAELRTLRLPHRLWLAPGGHDGSLWRAQLPAALEYAFGAGGLDSSTWTSSSPTSSG